MSLPKLNVFCVFLCVGLLSGCATIVDSGPDPLAVSSTPNGAQIYVDGALMGQTPATIPLDRASSGTIRVEKKGYEPVTMRKIKKLNGWLFGNICFGGPLGLVIDIVTDNHKKFDKQPVNVNLTPVDTAGDTGQPVSLRIRSTTDGDTASASIPEGLSE